MTDTLLPSETSLTGRWVEVGGQVRADPVCERIERLTNGMLDVVQDHPNAGGWKRLFCDPSDGRFWERHYPESKLLGGGPPALRLVDANEVAIEYGFRV